MAAPRSALENTNKLFFLVIYAVFAQSVLALPPAQLGEDKPKYLPSFAGPTAVPPQVRLHPGVVAAVVIVSLAAVVAAVFIIRKYCFPQSDATYRYSVLRQMEEHTSTAREDESDEDLLE